MFSCTHCDYTTDRSNNLSRHVSRKHSDNVAEHEGTSAQAEQVPIVAPEIVPTEKTKFHCSKCERPPFSSAFYARKHEETCNGLMPKQCGACLQIFETSQLKYTHNCPGQAATTNNNTNTTINNNTTTNTANTANNQNSNNINSQVNSNNTIINVPSDALPKILDFFSTNKQAVILCIQGNPAEIQLAHKYGFMHETLTSLTHFKGVPENRNITKVDAKTSSIWAMKNGRPLKGPLGTGIDLIMNNNRTIANNPEVKKYLTEDQDVDVLPIPETHAAYMRQRRNIRKIAEENGEFHSPIQANLPDELPEAPSTEEFLANMTIQEMGALPDSSYSDYSSLALAENNPDLIRCMQPCIKRACCEYTYAGNFWYKSVDDQTGWALCPKAPQEIYNAIHKLQQEAVAKLSVKRQAAEIGSGEYNRLLRMGDSLSRLNAKIVSDMYVNNVQDAGLLL